MTALIFSLFGLRLSISFATFDITFSLPLVRLAQIRLYSGLFLFFSSFPAILSLGSLGALKLLLRVSYGKVFD